MSTEKNKWIDALGKLLTLTQEGQLVWTTAIPPASFNSQPNHQSVDVIYQTQYKNRTLRLYELYHKVEKPKSPRIGLIEQFDPLPYPSYPYWIKSTVLQLLDENGLAAWTFPQMEVLNHLLEAVKYQVTGVRDFLDDILAEAV